MANIVHLRARRFDALFDILTGAAQAKLPAFYEGSDHLRKDIGLPEQQRLGSDAAPFDSSPVKPFHHALDRRPGQ